MIENGTKMPPGEHFNCKHDPTWDGDVGKSAACSSGGARSKDATVIRNERQQKVTLKQFKLLTNELDRLIAAHETTTTLGSTAAADLIFNLQRASLEGRIADLDAELMEV